MKPAHGQPFGFTREDVEALRALSAVHIGSYYSYTELADRIESLLPPDFQGMVDRGEIPIDIDPAKGIMSDG